ncbi:hypothetical protein IZY60_09625 [Lutibacter sp. B2]|nr:hypothetical protein [Lutibacter sp. B2]
MNITERIFKMENEMNLFECQICDVYFWKLIRLEIYENIMRVKESYGIAQNNTSFKVFEFMKNLPSLVLNISLRSWQLNFNRRDILVFRHGRKVFHKREYIDIYTKYIENELSEKNINFESIDFPANLTHKTNYNKQTSNVESPGLLMAFLHGLILKKIVIKKTLSVEEKNIIYQLDKRIYEEFGLKINLTNIIINAISKFKYRKKYFCKILKRKKPKIIYITPHYNRHELISAANDLNIKTVEVQHGIITPYHLGYSFRGGQQIPYFPDRLILYGSLWSKITNIPIGLNEIELRKFDYLYEKKTSSMVDKANVITIVSQGTISKELFEFAIALAKRMGNFIINYKLHPGEFLTWKEKKSVRDSPSNLKVVFDEVSIHDLFAESTHVIGVYSTAVFEALYFECEIGILKIPGYEYMDYLYSNGYARLIANIEEAKDFLDNKNLSYESVDHNIIFGGK